MRNATGWQHTTSKGGVTNLPPNRCGMVLVNARTLFGRFDSWSQRKLWGNTYFTTTPNLSGSLNPEIGSLKPEERFLKGTAHVYAGCSRKVKGWPTKDIKLRHIS